MENFNNFPLFTVIIPVRNRGEYLEHTLRTCMIQDYPNFEIIISDDDSTDNTKFIVQKAMKIDTRIKFYEHSPGLGMRDNFEFALDQVRPGYVIALGGDDGLIYGCIQKMHTILTKTKMELLTWSSGVFIYPGGFFNDKGRLVLPRKKRVKDVKIINSTDYLKRMSMNLNYTDDIESPMIYIKSVVSTELIDKVKSRSKDNRFYSCPTPDGYSGIVLAGEVEHYAFSGEPLSIMGASNASQGVAYKKSDKKSIEESNRFFKQNLSTPMHTELASQQYSPLISLMTADYLLTAKDLPGWLGQYPPIDYKNLIMKCFNELSDGFYSEDRIIRELEIIEKIAEKHDLVNYFNKLLESSRRHNNYKREFEGSGITPNSFLIDSSTFDINNIYDAAYATMFHFHLGTFITFKNLLIMIYKSIKHGLSRSGTSEKFPSFNKFN